MIERHALCEFKSMTFSLTSIKVITLIGPLTTCWKLKHDSDSLINFADGRHINQASGPLDSFNSFKTLQEYIVNSFENLLKLSALRLLDLTHVPYVRGQ